MEDKTNNSLKSITEKYCPLTYLIGKGPYDQQGFAFCVKEKCAWWDFNTGNCAILAIAKFGSKGTQEILKEEIRNNLDKEA